jgi:hypothetical protein
MEHRWGARTRIHVPIRLRPIHSPLEGIGRLTDLSLSGGFIVDFSIRRLARIQVMFDSPLRLRPEMLLAFVTRVSTEGIGIEWCEFAPRPVKELLRSVRIPSPVFEADKKEPEYLRSVRFS